LPEISIPWWNVRTGREELPTVRARTIEVVAAVGMNEPTTVEPTPKIISEQSASPVEVVQTYNPFWIWLSLFLACGWFVSGLLWWIARRQAAIAGIEAKLATPGLRQTSKTLKKACQENNAHAAREALLPWANSLDPDYNFTNLNELTQHFGGALKSQLKILNQGLYGVNADGWTGENLWQICAAIADSVEASKTADANGLATLNP